MQSGLKHLQGWFSQVPSNPNYSIVLRFLSFLSFSSSSAGIANLLLLLYLNYIFMIHKNIIYLNTYCFYILKMYFGIYLYILSLDFRYDISGQKHFFSFLIAMPGHCWFGTAWPSPVALTWQGREASCSGLPGATAQAVRYQALPGPQTPERAISWGLITYYF